MKNFINQYSLSKTLRFELIPQGKTLENIKNKGLITKDQTRADSYQKMKETIDGFHKHFIEIAMSQVELTKLDEFTELYTKSSEEKKKDEKFEDKFKKLQEILRKEIAQAFNTGAAKEIFSKIDKKELITEELEKWIKSENKEYYFDPEFKTFTTYFTGFHENRKNMYSHEEHSTAISYRLIHENLPKFIDNISIYKKAKESGIDINNIEENLDSALLGVVLDQVFSLDYFKCVLTQKGIDNYNLVLGGYTKENGKKIQGLNEIINLHNQKQEQKNLRIPKLKPLYKQILSDKESISFLPDAFKESQEVLNAIEEYYQANLINFKADDKEKPENVLQKVRELIADIRNYDLEKVYLKNDGKLTSISQKIFSTYSVFEDALSHYFDNNLAKNYKKKSDEAKEKFLKQSYFNIAFLQKAAEGYILSLEESHFIRKSYSINCVSDYFHQHFRIENKDGKEFDLISNINAKYSCIKGILGVDYSKDKKLHQEKTDITNIKAFLDSLMEILHFIKPLTLPKDSALEKDNNFYGQFEICFEQLDKLIPLYNKVRNYATQKAYSVEKIKLNFDNSTLLDGWDLNKESDNTSILLRKNGIYYLGIMDKKHNKIFKKIPNTKEQENIYEKIIYKLLPGANKMLPKVFFSNKNIKFFNPSKELLEDYKNQTHKKGDKFDLKHCHQLINFFKESISKHEDWKNFDFKFSDTNSYKDLSGFYREVEHQGYKITFQNVSEDYIDQLVSEGKLYLFKIHNKDFSDNSKGKPNLHTIYWKALFDESNLKNVIYKLNGQAEIFFRKKSIEEDKKIIHKAGDVIQNKNPDAKKKESVFDYDLIKDKRYTIDKFQFHVPITLNFKAQGKDYINSDVLGYLKNNPNVKIIGIDRGERHLVYLSLIDQKGNILHQESFNTISDDQHDIKTNYWKLLDKKEEEKKQAQESWGTIENIKELKEGYISQVVHKIAKMMVENNAIVIMEDLNFGFKRGRFKVEKQVYQKLEKMLIDKLNYLVFKDKNHEEIGGVYRAFQLTNKFESFKKLGKQSGFLFYVPAWNTSKIDPVTGFVNLFNTKYETKEKSQKFFSLFDSIKFNESENYFEFEVKKYSTFNTIVENGKQNWTICTYGDRIRTFRNSEKNNNWDNKIVILTDEFKSLFNKFQIDFKNDLKSQIIEQEGKIFFEKLFHLFKLTLQMRNSITGEDVDYLISPIRNNEGKFFDSRQSGAALPKDADANGAYHIAKKGLWILNKINKLEEKYFKKPNLTISNKEWLGFVQN